MSNETGWEWDFEVDADHQHKAYTVSKFICFIVLSFLFPLCIYKLILTQRTIFSKRHLLPYLWAQGILLSAPLLPFLSMALLFLHLRWHFGADGCRFAFIFALPATIILPSAVFAGFLASLSGRWKFLNNMLGTLKVFGGIIALYFLGIIWIMVIFAHADEDCHIMWSDYNLVSALAITSTIVHLFLIRIPSTVLVAYILCSSGDFSIGENFPQLKKPIWIMAAFSFIPSLCYDVVTFLYEILIAASFHIAESPFAELIVTLTSLAFYFSQAIAIPVSFYFLLHRIQKDGISNLDPSRRNVERQTLADMESYHRLNEED